MVARDAWLSPAAATCKLQLLRSPTFEGGAGAIPPRCGLVLIIFFRPRQLSEDFFTLCLSAQETEIFLTHDWANDELGRNNHERVKRVYHRLKELGVAAWFDEDAMKGDINATVIILKLTILWGGLTFENQLINFELFVSIRFCPISVGCTFWTFE